MAHGFTLDALLKLDEAKAFDKKTSVLQYLVKLVKANGNGVDQISTISIGQFTAIIQNIADARAENGAEQQRVQQSYELHQVNLVNLEAAHGRIMDVDVAMESTRFAKHNVLVQASASMTAQANQLSNIALTLLQ